MAEDTSSENSKKLDRLIALIEGEANAPGILGRLALHDEVLFGKLGQNGIVNKVSFMWRVHVWLLCGISGIVGYILKTIAEKFAHP